MSEAVRKHVIEELRDFRSNRQQMVRLTHQMREGGMVSSREYLALLGRLMAVKNGITASGYDSKLIYQYRYTQNLSWVAVSMKMNVGEATVKRYHTRLIEDVARSLGWI